MRVPHALAGVVAGLLCLTPLAVTAPAHAAESLTTLSTLNFHVYVPLDDEGSSGTVPYKEGDTVPYLTEFELGYALRASDGTVPQQGGAQVQIRTEADPVWTGLASFLDWRQIGEFHYFTPDRSAEYRVVYTGYVAKSDSEVSYAPSAAAPVAVNVSRGLKAKAKAKAKARAVGKVSPDYKNRRVDVLLKDGKRYVPFTTVRTNQNSRFRADLPAGRPGKRLHFRLRVPGNARFAPAVEDHVLRY